jgi:sugar (pentulose or hexulose) kinase
VLGLPYTAVSDVDAGTRGAAIVAMVAIGLSPPAPPADAAEDVTWPDPSTREAYDAAYERYRFWSEHLVEGYRRHSTFRPIRPEEEP